MKYMLLIHDSEKVWGALSQDEQQQIMADYRRFSDEIKATGQYLAGSQLQPTSAATQRARAQRQAHRDGWPVRGNARATGGYYLVDAKDLDEAIGLAERLPSAKLGTIEIRPLA